MGEKAIIEIAEALDSGIEAGDITWIRGTCVRMKDPYIQDDDIILPDFDKIVASKDEYCRSFALQYRSNEPVNGKRLIERYSDSTFIVQNPPQMPMETEELDMLYELPFQRTYHPSYEKDGGVPAIEEVKFSITANRGCFGGCAFCAITFHQGREVRGRSKESIEMCIRDRPRTGQERTSRYRRGATGSAHTVLSPMPGGECAAGHLRI